jgi:hypothetical protein
MEDTNDETKMEEEEGDEEGFFDEEEGEELDLTNCRCNLLITWRRY